MFELSFLNGSILAVAAAAVIPLLIYLFAKKKPRKVVFSTIRFIRAGQQKQNRKMNLLNILLLLIRMMIIFLAVMALARPTLKAPFLKQSTEHPPTAIAIILDTSYSMDYLVDTRSSLEKGLEIIHRINAMVSPQDIVLLITSDPKWNRINGNLHYGKLPAKLLANLKVTYLPTPYPALIQEAQTKLAQSQLPNREIYLISDLQKQAMPDKSEVPLFVIPTTPRLVWSNLSCQQAQPDVQLVNRQLTNSISFQVANHGPVARNDVLCRLFMDGRIIAEKFTDLGPNQRKTDNFTVQFETDGWHSGYVEVQDEKLSADNRSYFSFYHDLKPVVGVITDLPALPASLQALLQIYGGQSNNVKLLQSEDISQRSLDNVSLLVVYGSKSITPRLQNILQGWQQRKKATLFIADRNLSKDWQSYITSRFGVTWSGFSNKETAITFANQYQPVTALFDNRMLHKIRIADFWQTTANSTPLLASGNHPLALQQQSDFLWLFDPASFRNSFLLDSAYPVFAFRTLQYMNNTHFQAPAQKVGASVETDYLVLTNGTRLETGQHRFILDEPGIYGLVGKTGSQETIAVNHEYQESSYELLTSKKGSIHYLLNQGWEDSILQTRFGREIWKALFLLVLLLFALEMTLVKFQQRKSGSGE